MGFPDSSLGKESACSAGGLGLIPGSGRFLEGGHGNTLQYSCLENPMDRGAWWATIHGVARIRRDWATKHKHSPICYLRAQARKGSSYCVSWSRKKQNKTKKTQLCIYLVPNNTGCMVTDAHRSLWLGFGHSWAWCIISGLQAFVTRCSLMRNNLPFVWLFVLQISVQMAAPLGKCLFCSVWFRSPATQSDSRVGILVPNVMEVEGRDLGRRLGPGGGLICGIRCFIYFLSHVWLFWDLHELQPSRLLCPWDFPGKNTGVGCRFLLQGIYLT